MTSFTYTVTHPLGLHARPCFAISGAADEYACEITVRKGKEAANAKQRLELIGLGVVTGDELSFCFEGPDEARACEELRELVLALDADRDGNF